MLRPGGTLLVGFFLGEAVEPFDHAVITAYRWPPAAPADELRAAGYEVVETHPDGPRPEASPPRSDPRPHGAILAQLPPTN
ncbi:hypothetical protein [Microbacterium sp. NPDC056569]|uniref:hypothetical protein n=1 Tax=Microbacterium sp. NPDC056569 TaxID=3345867 RepID=UPI00366B95A5